MADYEALFPSRFIRSVDMQGRDVTLKIKSLQSEDIEDKTKAIMSFEDTKRQLVLNRTNAEACKLMWGRDTVDWIGKRLTLFPAVMKDPFGDGEITAIRVRGSPDITKAASAEVKRGRKTIKVSVIPTGKAAQKPVANGKGATPAKSNEPTEEEKAEILERERQTAAEEGLPS